MEEKKEKEDLKNFVKMHYGIYKKHRKLKIKQIMEKNDEGINGEFVIIIITFLILIYEFLMFLPEFKL